MFDYLNHQSPRRILIFGVALSALIAFSAFYSGSSGTILRFFVLPVCLVTWFAGSRPGMVLALACSLSSLVLQSWIANFHHLLVPLWDAAARSGELLVLALMVATFSNSHHRQEELTQFIVHDLRSPLTSLLAGLQTLQSLGTEMDDLAAETIEISLVSGERMLVLVNSLLDLPRMERGEMPLYPQDIHPQEVLYAAVREVSLWAESSHISFQLDFAETMPDIHVDPDITERILVNVLGNALKFSPEGGIVTVHAAATGTNEVTFSVTDQGPGIPADSVDRVFSKYGQIGPRKKGKGRGTGLGLTFCALAVKAQGGRIWLKSDVGAGTTVSFTVPVAAGVRTGVEGSG